MKEVDTLQVIFSIILVVWMFVLIVNLLKKIRRKVAMEVEYW